MATTKVNLDAMIPRSDFALQTAASDSVENIQTLGIEQLLSSSMVMKSLRKPDFQRETNHWTAQQLVSFLKSYVDRELIPSVILWQSTNFIFVIDGAHRLSAIRAWVNDDYGDKAISQKFYGHEIPTEQKKAADRVRKLISREINTYDYLRSASGETEGFSELVKERASTIASRAFSLQWVSGDAEKAESSFFKINTQGTPLHKTEERLLRKRKTPLAIVARAIVRAGTGNEYWSQFETDKKTQIVELSRELHGLLFTPEVNEPIKTLELPLGGSSSLIESLNLLMDFIELTAGSLTNDDDQSLNETDLDGSSSIKTLNQCVKILKKLTGNESGSLGLHPAIYFYNSRGKHSQHLFLAIISIFAKHMKNNNKSYFIKFISARGKLENFLRENKPLIGQAIVNIGSTSRVPRLIEMYEELIDRFSQNKDISTEELLVILKLQGKLVVGEIQTATGFNATTKSEIFLNTSLDSALKCPICGGLIDPSKSVSYDHIKRVQDGGKGNSGNGQLTHPYCNTGVKN